MPTLYREPVSTPAALARDPRTGRGRPVVSITTDFGARDPSTAICKGVVLTIAPGVTLIEITSEVAKFQVRDGALVLWCALPYLPVGVHVAVVDPGVGTQRLPIAVTTVRGDVLVGPDNGLLIPAAERLGGVVGAHVIENSAYRLGTVSTSFHGRDIFSPAAAHLALGVPVAELGRSLDPAALMRLAWPEFRVTAGALETAIVYVDTFGNVKLAGEPADLSAALGRLAPGDRLSLTLDDAGRTLTAELRWAETFGSVARGEPLVYEDSYGRLCLAANQASVASLLGLRDGMALTIRRA
jgi:hypothetical protein